MAVFRSIFVCGWPLVFMLASKARATRLIRYFFFAWLAYSAVFAGLPISVCSLKCSFSCSFSFSIFIFKIGTSPTILRGQTVNFRECHAIFWELNSQTYAWICEAWHWKKKKAEKWTALSLHGRFRRFSFKELFNKFSSACPFFTRKCWLGLATGKCMSGLRSDSYFFRIWPV